MIQEEEDKCFSIKNDIYTISQSNEVMLLKRILIEKKPLYYSFVGGMWYSKEKFSLEDDISLPYPFTTYYTTKILDESHEGNLCRSLIYVKMPLLVLQFKDECVAIEFDPVIKLNNQEIFPFIALEENDDKYIVSFYLFNNFRVKEKKYAWLGFGKKRKIDLDLQPGNTFRFSIKATKCKDWKDAVKSSIIKKIPDTKKMRNPSKTFKQGKQALWRSYDHLTGSFLQLPWRNTPNFTFVNSSYTLLSYEAVRLHYFSKWYKQTDDKQFLEWRTKLRGHFTNPQLFIKTPKEGHGIIWYNMTNLTRRGLQGYFYMDCGYAGYPGGQATIAVHLLKYLEAVNDEEIKHLVEKSLEYILSTQKKNGAWPMAIRQEGVIRLRPENLQLYETHGGTGECARALLQGSKKFNNKKMKKAALNALAYLETATPICYNGLRDIGVQEPEAFSAVSIIDAFLDAYEITNNKKYLDAALIYAYYTLTWFYLYDTEKLSLKFNFHPISYSITPRLSPYENVWIVSTYLRLYTFTKDKLWKQLAKKSYNEGAKWVTKNGGLCEGIFPTYLSELKRLPMEQTFATVELMNAASRFFTMEKNDESNIDHSSNNKLELQQKGEVLSIIYDKEVMLTFDFEKCKVVFLKGAGLNDYGISFSFYDPYSLKNKIVRTMKKYLRGGVGKFVLGILDTKYFLKGVYGNKPSDTVKVRSFEKHKKKTINVQIDGDSAKGYCETDIHRVEFTITSIKKGKKLHIFFDPLIIKVLDHDLSCKQVLFPLIGKKLEKKSNKQLHFDGFSIRGDFKSVVTTDEFTAVDQTLSTNWTHGGMYKGKFEIILEKT